MNPVYAEAIATFASLFEEAKASSGELEPNAMSVATATAEGVPSARIVLLKSFDAEGFVFYTHLHSRKGNELEANPHAALLFLWRSLRAAGIQVRIEGKVEVVADSDADSYFASRPRLSQVGAWASAQSETLESREQFEARIASVEAEFEGRDIPRPRGWSGYRVAPAAIEFWYGAEFRLHDRDLYERLDGAWSLRQLYP